MTKGGVTDTQLFWMVRNKRKALPQNQHRQPKRIGSILSLMGIKNDKEENKKTQAAQKEAS
jgi:hypothetical protein